MRFDGKVAVRRLHPVPVCCGMNYVGHALTCCVSPDVFNDRVGDDQVVTLRRNGRWRGACVAHHGLYPWLGGFEWQEVEDGDVRWLHRKTAPEGRSSTEIEHAHGGKVREGGHQLVGTP